MCGVNHPLSPLCAQICVRRSSWNEVVVRIWKFECCLSDISLPSWRTCRSTLMDGDSFKKERKKKEQPLNSHPSAALSSIVFGVLEALG